MLDVTKRCVCARSRWGWGWGLDGILTDGRNMDVGTVMVPAALVQGVQFVVQL